MQDVYDFVHVNSEEGLEIWAVMDLYSLVQVCILVFLCP